MITQTPVPGGVGFPGSSGEHDRLSPGVTLQPGERASHPLGVYFLSGLFSPPKGEVSFTHKTWVNGLSK